MMDDGDLQVIVAAILAAQGERGGRAADVVKRYRHVLHELQKDNRSVRDAEPEPKPGGKAVPLRL